MQSSLLTTTTSTTRRPFSAIKAGDLVTVNVYNPETGNIDQEAGARVKRMAYGNVWIQIAGLSAPKPYEIGDNLVLSDNQVIDW